MADVRCPMCGKANPEDLKECQYCHARLSPIWNSASNVGQSGPAEEQDDGLPEWLKSLRLPQEEQSAVTEPEPENDNNLPDWLSDLREQPVDPGYLQSEAIPSTDADSSDEDSSDWLQRFLAEDNLPEDNLAEAEEENVSGVASEAALQDEADWLSRIDTTPIEDKEPQETGELPGAPGVISPDEQDWSAPKETQPPESTESLLDWLTPAEPESTDRLEPEIDQAADLAQSSKPPEPTGELDIEEELPAWLFQTDGEVNPIAATGDVDLIDAELEIPRDSEPRLSPPEDEAVAISEELAPEGESLEELTADLIPEAPSGEQETPAEKAAPFLAVAGAAAIAHDMDLGEELPEEDLEWLDELEATYGDLSSNAADEQSPKVGAAAGLGSESDSSLPEWLIVGSVEKAEISEESLAEEDVLKPAELPSWLQAMRPVGVTAAAASVLDSPESQQIEGAGPLAGLRGALPAEPDISKVQKPPVYSIKLQVTDSQQLQAELLHSLIDSEGEPEVLQERSVIGPQKVIRLLIAAFLIVPLLLVLFTGTPQLDMPVLPLEVEAVGMLIDSLPPGAPVLLAVDYQPGFSGEMDTITAPVVQHLYDRGAYLAAVSTIATGPVQAEHLFTQMRVATGASVQANANYANLGYIPGGATGLLAFAQSPREVLPTNLRGEPVWGSPALQTVDTLEKFAMVVVATENPDVARYWIEQIQHYLGATPLVMVLSAQAEPVVRPYYEANPPQVQGLVGGLAGGAAYLSQSARSGAATRFWSPFGVGALIAVLLMVLAGLANLVTAQAGRRKQVSVGGKGA
ncbi:MAG: hypothetical protein A2W35_06370 [Chloroflexi bacterium RBG_16_57_11]|nr:MAG: hypothetical protein A2W35_06370 [Chloroflexi bacterium RBG_16_57_11]